MNKEREPVIPSTQLFQEDESVANSDSEDTRMGFNADVFNWVDKQL